MALLIDKGLVMTNLSNELPQGVEKDTDPGAKLKIFNIVASLAIAGSFGTLGVSKLHDVLNNTNTFDAVKDFFTSRTVDAFDPSDLSTLGSAMKTPGVIYVAAVLAVVLINFVAYRSHSKELQRQAEVMQNNQDQNKPNGSAIVNLPLSGSNDTIEDTASFLLHTQDDPAPSSRNRSSSAPVILY